MKEDENIKKALDDLSTWLNPLMKQFQETGTLNDQDSKMLLKIRDIVKRIEQPVKKEPSAQAVHPMEMTVEECFAGLNPRRNEMQPQQQDTYDRIVARWNQTSPKGIELGFGEIGYLRNLYLSLYYK